MWEKLNNYSTQTIKIVGRIMLITSILGVCSLWIKPEGFIFALIVNVILLPVLVVSFILQAATGGSNQRQESLELNIENINKHDRILKIISWAIIISFIGAIYSLQTNPSDSDGGFALSLVIMTLLFPLYLLIFLIKKFSK
jgi:hypothetical protein